MLKHLLLSCVHVCCQLRLPLLHLEEAVLDLLDSSFYNLLESFVQLAKSVAVMLKEHALDADCNVAGQAEIFNDLVAMLTTVYLLTEF